MDMLCCKCKKRPAMLFVAKFDGKEMVNEGYCLKCASELGLPQVQAMMDKMGITPQDLDDMDDQLAEMDGMFEPGGADTLPPFMQKLFDNSNLPSEAANPEPGREGFPPPRGKREEKKDRRQQRKYLGQFLSEFEPAGAGQSAGSDRRQRERDLSGDSNSFPETEK